MYENVTNSSSAAFCTLLDVCEVFLISWLICPQIGRLDRSLNHNLIRQCEYFPLTLGVRNTPGNRSQGNFFCKSETMNDSHKDTAVGKQTPLSLPVTAPSLCWSSCLYPPLAVCFFTASMYSRQVLCGLLSPKICGEKLLKIGSMKHCSYRRKALCLLLI